jgi:hypothetical protein
LGAVHTKLDKTQHKRHRTLPPPVSAPSRQRPRRGQSRRRVATHAYKLVEHFVEQGLLREITGSKRGKFYLFDPYLKLYRS